MNESDQFDEVVLDLIDFRDERDWQQFHTPRNLYIAMTGEVGELGSLFQWVNDADVAGWVAQQDNHQRVSEEVADILAYLILFSESVGIHPLEALKDKILVNKEKYPVDKAYGSAQKYTEFSKTDIGQGDGS